MTPEQESYVERLTRKGWKVVSTREKVVLRKPGDSARVQVYPDGGTVFYQKGKG